MIENNCDLIGLGIGPFNLSLAALAQPISKIQAQFFDRKAKFDWHKELMLPGTTMQTTYLKDLVSAVNPTSPYSFLNYLVRNKLYYAFLNTGRTQISRMEFERYCQWVCQQLDGLFFSHPIREVQFDGQQFVIKFDEKTVYAKHICLGTGLLPHVPDCAKDFLSDHCFHAKSPYLQNFQATKKRILIVGGGQTGAELFLNLIRAYWGEAKSVHWLSRRANLEPLDESAFVNEYFTPGYVQNFYHRPQSQKDEIAEYQKLSGDGITPGYLQDIYCEVYQRRFLQDNALDASILPNRELTQIKRFGNEYEVSFYNKFYQQEESFFADVIILATGFKQATPECLEPLYSRMDRNDQGQLQLNENFRVSWDGSAKNFMYAVNFGRHSHGIAEPQISLMSWRAAVIINDLLGFPYYDIESSSKQLIDF
ncbi:MAG: lysine N(6)-hydroxylase/L-ornithine N(5)-oxygenase family protein [Oligoflexus sp.]